MSRRVNALLTRGADWLASDAADRATVAILALIIAGMWSLGMVHIGRAIERAECAGTIHNLAELARQQVSER
jgi:hypothetical protein